MVARSIAFLCLTAGAAAAIAPLSITGPPVPGRMHVIAGPTDPIAASGAAAPGGYNQTYGYPDGIGGLIVENPFAGSNFPIWSDQNRWGAVGMIIAPGTFGDDKKCQSVHLEVRAEDRSVADWVKVGSCRRPDGINITPWVKPLGYEEPSIGPQQKKEKKEKKKWEREKEKAIERKRNRIKSLQSH